MWLFTGLQYFMTSSKGWEGSDRRRRNYQLLRAFSSGRGPHPLFFHFFLICIISPQDAASHGFQEYSHQYSLGSSCATQHKPDRLACVRACGVPFT